MASPLVLNVVALCLYSSPPVMAALILLPAQGEVDSGMPESFTTAEDECHSDTSLITILPWDLSTP